MAGGGFVDSYYYFLKYTMKEGIMMGLYQFIVGMGFMTADADLESKVGFISQWMWDSWGNDSAYYKSSKLIWIFLLDDTVGICQYDAAGSLSGTCYALKYYWMFIMTLNVFVTLPLSHVAAVYDYVKGYYDKGKTVAGWF